MRVAESSQLQLDKQKEDWMSGLNQQFTKLSTGKTVREFESHILRKLRSVVTIICAVQNNDHREYILPPQNRKQQSRKIAVFILLFCPRYQ